MSSKLDSLKQRLSKGGQSEPSIVTEFYTLAKELSCLPDLLGREYEFIYEGKKLIGMKQLPIKIPTYINLVRELAEDYKRQSKKNKSPKGRGRRR